MDYFPQLTLILLLIFAGGFFTAAEYAIIAVRKTRIDALAKRNNTLAKRVRAALDRKEEYISTTQLGSTIVNLVLGWIGEPALAGFFTSLYRFFGIPPSAFLVHFSAIILSFITLTFLSILFAELLPKTIALHKSEGLAFATILPVTFFARLFSPFTRILNTVERFILSRLHISLDGKEELTRSKEELRIFLSEVTKIGIISKHEQDIVNNVFEMNEKHIRQLIVPRSEIEAVDGTMSIEQLIKRLNYRYSRFPVYLRNIDNIIGFIHIKDLFSVPRQLMKVKLAKSSILRKVISIPDTKKINEVFLDMRRRHVHMAVIYNEFGTVLGMVTLEDIIESVLGDIQDEFDKSLGYMKRESDGSYAIDGNTPLSIIQEKFRIAPGNITNTTIGGYVFALLGHEPHVSDKIQSGNFVYTITSVRGKRIAGLNLARVTPSTADGGGSKKRQNVL